MQLRIGFSPCPNDTFIFDALVNKKIDTEGLDFEAVLEDVETLNKWALNGKLPVTKLSYGVLPLVLDQYVLLNSGSALGRGVGPLLISNLHVRQAGWEEGILNKEEGILNKEQGILNKEQEILNKEQGRKKVELNTIAIPGEHTTAHMLFSLAYPGAKNKIFMRYDEIENFVLQNKGLGVIIHENRFTYEQKGLFKITDLGDYWEKKTGNPIPLGGIVIKRSIDIDIQQKIERLIKKSIEYAFSNYPVLNDYITDHSQEMSEEVMRKHIELYVNHYSLDLEDIGKNAVKKMITVYNETNHTNVSTENLFVEP